MASLVEQAEAAPRERPSEAAHLTTNLLLLGRAHRNLGHAREAEKYWQLALEHCGSVENGNIYIRMHKALAYLYLDHPDQARPLILGLQESGFGTVWFWKEVARLTGEYHGPKKEKPVSSL